MEAKEKYKVMVDGQVSNIEVDLQNFTIIEHKGGDKNTSLPALDELSEFTKC